MRFLKVVLEINDKNIERIKVISDALSNESRIKSLLLIGEDRKMSLNSFHKKAEENGIYANIETSYRNLEIMVTSGLLKKTYDSTIKKLVYDINEEVIDVVLSSFEPVSVDC